MTTTYLPHLRGDIEVRDDPNAGPVLVDPGTGHAVRLTAEWERALPPLLDGTRSLAALRAELPTAPGEELAVLIKSLRFLHMMQDAGTEIRDAIVSGRKNPDAIAGKAPLRVQPEARFGCASSGMCCTGHSLGPLDQSDLKKLESLPLADFPALADRPPLKRVRLGDEDAALLFLNQRPDGRCVFLEDDNLCGLHKRFGAEAKPGFCRLFPHEVMLTPSGIFVLDHAGCAAYGTTAFQGPTLRETVAADASRFRREAQSMGLIHKAVSLDGLLSADMELTLPVELLGARIVERPQGTILNAIAGLKTLVEALREAILTSDDAVATPKDVVLGVAERAIESFAFEGDPTEPFGIAMVPVVERLARLAERVVEAATAGGRDHEAESVLMPAAELVHVAAVMSAAAAGTSTLDRDSQAAAASKVAVDLSTKKLDARLRRLLRDLVFARGLALGRSMRAGVVFLAMIMQIIPAGAAHLAATRGAKVMTPSDLDRAQFLILRLLRFADVKSVLLADPVIDQAYADLPG